MKQKESVRKLGDLTISIGDGIEFAQDGDIIECISRKESKNPKTTAKLTIGKSYKIENIRFMARPERKEAWGYITVKSDIGALRDYPLHRFRFQKGVERAAKGWRVKLCPYCGRRKYQQQVFMEPTCDCLRGRIGELPGLSVTAETDFGKSIYRVYMRDKVGWGLRLELPIEILSETNQQELQEYLLREFIESKKEEVRKFEAKIMGYVPPTLPRIFARPFDKGQEPEFLREALGEWKDVEPPKEERRPILMAPPMQYNARSMSYPISEKVDAQGDSLAVDVLISARDRLLGKFINEKTPAKKEPAQEPLMPEPGKRKLKL